MKRWILARAALPIRAIIFSCACLLLALGVGAAPDRPTGQHSITIDATALTPQSWWQVPGVTPTIWTQDPETSDAYRTTEVRHLSLPAGPYKFVSFTFDFSFRVAEDGTIQFAPSLDECVRGRGTDTLEVRCKRTYPYGGKPEY